MMLTKEEVQKERIAGSRIFHFGTLSFTHPGVREASCYAIDCAKEAGALISFDPNLREPLWASLEDAREAISYGLSRCDILKISDNEVEFMTGETDYRKGAEILREKYGIPLMFVTLGPNGSMAFYKDLFVTAEPFLQETTIETTGAGDTFTACVLNGVLEYGMEGLNEQRLREMLTFANAGASLITTRRGALKVMAEREEIEALVYSWLEK